MWTGRRDSEGHSPRMTMIRAPRGTTLLEEEPVQMCRTLISMIQSLVIAGHSGMTPYQPCLDNHGLKGASW